MGIAISLMGSGCHRNLSPDGVYKGDQFLYETDNAISHTKKLLNDFVGWEKNNRLLLWQADKGIKKAADHVRANAKKWVKSAINLREAYALNPSPENRSALQTTLNILEAALNEAVAYQTKYDPDKALSITPKPLNK